MKLYKFVISLVCLFALTSCNAAVNSKEDGLKVDYGNKMISNSKNLPTVIFYYATWCPYCKQADPVVKQLAQEYNGKVIFFPVDVDTAEGKKLAATFKNGQDAIPHFQFFGKKGNLMEDKLGYMPAEELKQKLKANFQI